MRKVVSGNGFCSDYGGDNLPGPVLSPPQYMPNPNTALLRSNSQSVSEETPWSSSTTSSKPAETCVICHGTPDGQSIYPTCVMACSSKRLTTCRHGLPNANEPRPSDSPNMSSTPNISNKKRESPRQLSEPTPPSYADKPIEMCVICNSAPVYIDGPKIYPTCGMACTSKLLGANDLPNTNKPRTSDPPSMSSAPNIFDKNRESPRSTSKPTRTFANTPIEMCVICISVPVYRDGPNIYATCGMECASKLRAASGLPNTNKPRTSDLSNMSSAPSTFENLPTGTWVDRRIGICVICNSAPVYRDGPNIYATCGMECASNLSAASASSLPTTNNPRISDPSDISSAPNNFDNNWESPRWSSEPTRTYADRSVGMCVICNSAPVYRDGPNIHATCGIACASKLRPPNTNEPRTSEPPNMPSASEPTRTYADRSIGMCVTCNSAPVRRDGPNIYTTCGCASKLHPPIANEPRTSDPPNSAFMSSEFPRNNAYITLSHARPNQIGMCDVCHVRPRYQRGSKVYPTCGLSCAAKLKAPDSVEMCDYCKKRPKVVIDGKTYPQCGSTCRDKAKHASMLRPSS